MSNNNYFIKNKVLETLEEKNTIKEKLEDYIYIDELDELYQGHFYRWIKYNNSEKQTLSRGGFLISITFYGKNIKLLMKLGHRFQTILFDDIILFKKNKNI